MIAVGGIHTAQDALDKLKEDDIVKVEVINYNPLKYMVAIEQKQIKYKPLMEPQVLGSVMSVFNQKNSIQNVLVKSVKIRN
jgi:hypothetical protein